MSEGKKDMAMEEEIKHLKDRIESLEKELSAVKEGNHTRDEAIEKLQKTLEVNNELIKKHLPHIEGLEKVKRNIIPAISEVTGYAPKEVEETFSKIGDTITGLLKGGG